MIEKTEDIEKIYRSLSGRPDIFSGKIKALLESYGTGYDFLSFYVQDKGVVIGKYYGGSVISGNIPDEEGAEELKSFLPTLGKGVLMSLENGERLGIADTARKGCIMKFTDSAPREGDLTRDDVTTWLSYREIYEILKDGFDMSFDEWYVDINHNVRHGISTVYSVGNASTATVMFTVDGISFVSAVATRPEMRGRGIATKLLRYIGKKEKEARNDCLLICKEELLPFYTAAGFTLSGYSVEI